MEKNKNGKHTTETGTEIWYRNGKKHRKDGPAVIRACGVVEYWLYGKQVTSFMPPKGKEDLK